jgi:DNA-binding CsgD family transcriptional regulator
MKNRTSHAEAPETALPDPNRAMSDAVLDVLSSRTDTLHSKTVVFNGVRYSVYWRAQPHTGVAAVIVPEGQPASPPIEISSCYRLTPRECEVARLLALRYSNKEISTRLGISPHTAWRHTDNVLAKLGVSTRRHVMDVLKRPHDRRPSGAMAVT